MTFLAPIRLWLLIGVGGLLVLYVLAQMRRRKYALRFTNMALLDQVAPNRPGWRRHLPAAAFLLAVAALVLGFAVPARDTRVPKERATIMLALDTSLSMEATDVTPSRIQAAQSAAKAFVDQLPARINLGLVTFNGNATVAVSPTTDREAVKTAIDRVKLGERTAIGEAIFSSLGALSQLPPVEGTDVPARIVLMTDGTTTDGRSNDQAVAAAKTAQVPVTTIAFGTDHGTIKLPQEPFPIPVPVDKAALKSISADTGGQFYAAASESQLKQVYDNIGSSVGFVTELREISVWFIAAALVLLLLTGALSLLWFQRLP
ncbi:MAG: VWA domain-containing protein [Actinomycetes bacterium]